MNRLIDDLLDTASVDAGHLSVEAGRLVVAPVVLETLEALAPTAASKSVQLRNELPQYLPPVFADPARLQQVFTNLVVNAIKFTPQGGTVTLRANCCGNEVCFSVLDSGAGIPSEDLDRLFDRFWQAERTAKLGTGLGL